VGGHGSDDPLALDPETMGSSATEWSGEAERLVRERLPSQQATIAP
jgi:hypothetical protein